MTPPALVPATPAASVPAPPLVSFAAPPVASVPVVPAPAADILPSWFSSGAPAEANSSNAETHATAVPPTGGPDTPPRPGLAFGEGLTPGPAPEAEPRSGEEGGLPEVSRILNEAQALFQTGQHEAASNALVRAAQAYDRIGRFDNAAAIYRNLSQVTEAPLQVMMLWLKNCQRRDDRHEAARVACNLGDRALRDGDALGAREWFERARAYDQDNELAHRRLQRLNPPAEEHAVATAAQPIAPPPPLVAPEPAAPELEPQARGHSGIVEVTVGAASVDLDLGLLINEFQRKLDVQLAADCQGHYDLGMSYREMGLFSEAIHSFELAASDPKFRVRASEMIGRSLLDQGDLDGAVTTFSATLSFDDLDPSAVSDIRYQLGLALEAAGRMSEALAEFEQIYAKAPSYPQVASKIRALRKALGRT
jgi:tetratricopeptide (TPR) repeat protein